MSDELINIRSECPFAAMYRDLSVEEHLVVGMEILWTDDNVFTFCSVILV